MRITVVAIEEHPRGRTYRVKVKGRTISILLTFHALDRIARWGVSDRKVLQALLFPEEVLRGHRDRFIAQRRSGSHVIRVIYEYAGDLPVVITVYEPSAARYFRGGGTHEDRILA